VSVVPDYAAPLIGWRTWTVVEEGGGLTLRSVVYESRWPPRERLVAVCGRRSHGRLLARWRRVQPHEAPDDRCECGIYAACAPDLALSFLFRLGLIRGVRSALIGRVALWGRVIECERGWRATFAYPTQLYVLRAPASRRQRPDARGLARDLAVYGVPVQVVEACTMEALVDDLAGEGGALLGAA